MYSNCIILLHKAGLKNLITLVRYYSRFFSPFSSLDLLVIAEQLIYISVATADRWLVAISDDPLPHPPSFSPQFSSSPHPTYRGPICFLRAFPSARKSRKKSSIHRVLIEVYLQNFFRDKCNFSRRI